MVKTINTLKASPSCAIDRIERSAWSCFVFPTTDGCWVTKAVVRTVSDSFKVTRVICAKTLTSKYFSTIRNHFRFIFILTQFHWGLPERSRLCNNSQYKAVHASSYVGSFCLIRLNRCWRSLRSSRWNQTCLHNKREKNLSKIFLSTSLQSNLPRPRHGANLSVLT